MEQKLSDLVDRLRQATSPEEIFGTLGGDPTVALKRRYRELVAVAHPDRNPGQAAAANEACMRLQEWYAAAQRRVAQGSYGTTPQISLTSRLFHYQGYAAPLRGDLCDLFPAEAGGMPVLLKVVRRPRNNDLLQAESQALQRIERQLRGQPARAHFPTLIEHFVLRDAAKVQRSTNVLRHEEDYVTLAQVMRAYPTGLPLGDAAWMFNRLLAALGVAHSLGLVHGAVVPEHLLIRPADHNGMLIDWCYSVEIGRPLKALSPAYTADYPPEVVAGQPLTPAADCFLAARCLMRLLGGRSADDLPPGIPKALRLLLRACTIPAPQRRPADAWQLYDDFQEILQRLYGPRKFRPFRMPTATVNP